MNAAVTLIRAVGGGWDDSQLPWPKNLYSPPTVSSAPVTSIGAANPPASDVSVSTAAVVAVSPSTPTIYSVPVAVSVSTTPAAVSSSTTTVSPSTPTYQH